MTVNHLPEPDETTTKRYYGISGMMVAMHDGASLKYFTQDHLSSTSLVMNASGGLLSQNRYMPFGEVRDITGNLDPITQTDFGYTGQRNLAGMGLMDYKARFYSPLLGRFTQPDTFIPNPGNPQSFNRYSYGLNNPVKYIDPSGNIPLPDKPLPDESQEVLLQLRKTIAKYDYVSYVSSKFEIEFTGKWSIEDQYEVAKGVFATGRSLKEFTTAQDAGEAFREIFQPLEMRWMEGVCWIQGGTCAGDAYLGPDTIRFWRYYRGEGGARLTDINAGTAVHELGHIFDQLTERDFRDAVRGAGVIDRTGFGMRRSNSAEREEIAADYFLNYVFDSFTRPDFSTLLDNDWQNLVNLAVDYDQ